MHAVAFKRPLISNVFFYSVMFYLKTNFIANGGTNTFKLIFHKSQVEGGFHFYNITILGIFLSDITVFWEKAYGITSPAGDGKLPNNW